LGDTKLEDIIIEDASGIKIVPGNSGAKEFLNLDEAVKERLLQEIWNLERSNDFIILDTASGLSPMIIDFATRANEVILVSTSEPTSITDTYALAKILYSYWHDINLKLILNLVSSKNEAYDIYERLTFVFDHFLGRQIALLGYIERDEAVRDAVMHHKPFVLAHPKSSASRCVYAIADKIIQNEKGQTK